MSIKDTDDCFQGFLFSRLLAVGLFGVQKVKNGSNNVCGISCRNMVITHHKYGAAHGGGPFTREGSCVLSSTGFTA